MIQSHLDNDIATNATVNSWIDEANQWLWNLIKDAEFKRKEITLSTVANQQTYTLPPCVAQIIRIYNAGGEIPLVSEREYIGSLQDTTEIQTTWDQTQYRELDPDKVGKLYSTGTVSGTAATKTLYGDGTAWNTGTNCELGDVLTVGTDYYNVEAITDDTTIILAQKINTNPAGATYTLEGINRKRIKFTGTPTSVETVTILCTTPAYPLVSDYDYPRVPADFHDLIGLKAIMIGHEYDEDIRNFGMVQALFKEEEERFVDFFSNKLGRQEKFNSLADSDTFDHSENM